MAARFLLLLALVGAGLARAEEARVIPALYPEGPLWQGERLYFAEMRADRVMRVDAGIASVFFAQDGCGPTADVDDWITDCTLQVTIRGYVDLLIVNLS